ncbi:phosphoribosylglycinamide formyltransferase [Maribrevibacterium harenarium]|uniref:Phosphoribosylglycinamide formyltransferase n=1 Tax=Maribrevibacterium harenarium TaxID=2589817 RepID=A0A501WHQ9_9GAMM|nr:phosphoribosylglycinamide formyltransferase [Maribrevibacterium harenarium]TPE48898.1 phosphoribosylglycinamide formyltransferase [Maribrevibacterium harenarium]
MSLSVVILISGSGSNLQAFIDQHQAGKLDIDIKAVISNKAEAFGLERARRALIPTHALSHKDYDSREAFDTEMMSTIDQYQPDLVILAGFMRILTPEFTHHYQGRLVNIHPSLLPKYKGLNTHQRAIDAGECEHGVSVHFVSAELDAGAVIIQASVPISPEDNADTLAAKVHQQEHLIYPLAVKWFSEGRLRFDGTHAILDDHILGESGINFEPNLLMK